MYMLLAVDPILEPALEWVKAHPIITFAAVAAVAVIFKDNLLTAFAFIKSKLPGITTTLEPLEPLASDDTRVQGYRVLIELVDAQPPLSPEGRKACDTLAVELLERRKESTT